MQFALTKLRSKSKYLIFFTLSKTLKDRLPRHLRWLAMTNLFMLIFILTVTDFFDSLEIPG